MQAAIQPRDSRIRPSRRAFMGTILACVAAPALPRIETPEMRFYSVCFQGEVIELFDWMVSESDDHAWTIIPAYTETQAVKQMQDRIRNRVLKCDWERSFGDESHWLVKSCESVSESEVIAASKDWGVRFDTAAGRLMSWQCEYDAVCDCCGMYSMDGSVPTCEECYRCKPCVLNGETWTDENNVEQAGQCPDCCWA